MRIAPPTLTRQNLVCAVALGLIFLSAPFPRLQLVLHAMLVIALAPRAGVPLMGALWALAAGWTMEGSLRLYPHLGGTPWADMSLALLAGWMAGRWPLEGLKGWLARLAALSLLHAILVHLAVRLATAPHPWGWGWFWVLLTTPLWGWAAWRLLHPGAGSGRR
ncbi:hypothetical protein GETHLI_20330 [Geothrix limicola]|uniref:Rod shape-determining protein MreD n=1 Tax=Geothrix limicola TaxID=2927978 RepID=A0ABQ5QG74_9BACT|nr:hypothetical protein [Geothrix limicola]GLH73531.1 hypothetical protein GETHLI_20330 [Geothrix limicola]